MPLCRFSPELPPRGLTEVLSGLRFDTPDNAPAGVLSHVHSDVYPNAPQVKIRKKARSSKGCADNSHTGKPCANKTSTDTTCPDTTYHDKACTRKAYTDQSCPDPNCTDKLSPISSEVALNKARQKTKSNQPNQVNPSYLTEFKEIILDYRPYLRTHELTEEVMRLYYQDMYCLPAKQKRNCPLYKGKSKEKLYKMDIPDKDRLALKTLDVFHGQRLSVLG